MIAHPDSDEPSPLWLYLAGPMSVEGLPLDPVARAIFDHRKLLASGVEGRLTAAGYIVLSPYSSGDHPDNWSIPKEEWLNAACHKLLTCNGIVMLPGWEESEGAQVELEYARRMGLDLYLWDMATTSLLEMK